MNAVSNSGFLKLHHVTTVGFCYCSYDTIVMIIEREERKEREGSPSCERFTVYELVIRVWSESYTATWTVQPTWAIKQSYCNFH